MSLGVSDQAEELAAQHLARVGDPMKALVIVSQELLDALAEIERQQADIERLEDRISYGYARGRKKG